MRRTWRCWFSHGSLALPKIEASVDAVEAASSSLACMMTSARTGLGAGGGGILSREVRIRRGDCVENCKLSPLTGSLVSTPHLRGRRSRWRLGRGADIQTLLAGRRIEDRELEPTSTGHPRFGRKDEAEAIRRRRKRSSRESQRSNFESRTASDRRGRHRRGVRSL